MAKSPDKFQAPRGTHDILPAETPRWKALEQDFRALCDLYRYHEIRTPLFEDSRVIHRTSGETSDIVSKETYDFLDRGGDSLTLRPEGTAPVLRAAIQGGLLNESPFTRLSYIAPMFRYDRPQKGRFRQHHQVGIEALGSDDPAVDAEVIAFGQALLARLGIDGVTLRINSVGSPEDRPAYREALVAYFTPLAEDLSEESRRRLETNPLRILDSKDPGDRALIADAPSIFGSMSEENLAHFEAVKGHLDALGIAYTVDDRLVRGLDYYTRTAFEWIHAGVGTQASLGGGGRYNGLVAALGGPPAPGIGWGMGIERLLLAQESGGGTAVGWPPVQVYVVAAGDAARDPAFLLVQEARAAGLAADFDTMHRAMGKQMNAAGKLGARFALILGEDELAAGTVTVRDMDTKEQWTAPRADAVQRVREALGPPPPRQTDESE